MLFQVGAVTDEFSPDSLDRALDAMADLGMTFAELRVVDGKNIIDLTDAELDSVRARVEARGMRVLSIASPLLKCALPDAPPVASHIQQDMFSSAFGFEDQPRVARRAFEIAARTGAGIVRVFSYWRTIDPDACFDRVASALRDLAEQAAERGVIIGIENEHACNIATGAETGRLLAAVDHPALQVIWDPANAFVAGEAPFPEGYSHLPVSRIVHVHAKDCTVARYVPTWGPLGEMDIDWRGQLAALARDGYRATVSLETHWKGPNGDKFYGSMICGRALNEMVRAADASRK
ncbi:MAG TPA: sugar phosphate isomerase/epimerase family protein [Vicinamibacterales bacterium]|nr:sugar phosphate isomerase/epimerase family protein [Vicinamibacterales bacterium]